MYNGESGIQVFFSLESVNIFSSFEGLFGIHAIGNNFNLCKFLTPVSNHEVKTLRSHASK